MGLSTKQKVTYKHKSVLTRGWGGGGINWEPGTDLYTLLYTKLIASKELPRAQGTLLNTRQWPVGKGY